MPDLNSGNNCSNSRYYYVCYRLLDGKIYVARIDANQFKTSNSIREFVFVYELNNFVKIKKSIC